MTTPARLIPAPTRPQGSVRIQLLKARLLRAGLLAVYLPMRLLPRRAKVVMTSREHTAASADFHDLVAALHRRHPELPVVLLVRMVPEGLLGQLRYVAHLLVQLYHVATCRVLVVDTYSMVASLLPHGRGLRVIQIWHALGAFKKFGLSILDRPEGRDSRLARTLKMHQGYDVVLASSPASRPAFAEAFGVRPDQVTVAPLPRVDRLLDPKRAKYARQQIYRAHPSWTGERIALFAPTFRMDGGGAVDTAELARALRGIGLRLVVKAHPLSPAAVSPAGTETGVETAKGFSTQDLLHVADVFITDYSSALFEAALLGVPSYFLAPDLDEYLASRDFYLDYRRDLPGPVVTTVAELVDAIQQGRGTAARATSFGAHWVQVPAVPGSPAPCTDQIADLILQQAQQAL